MSEPIINMLQKEIDYKNFMILDCAEQLSRLEEENEKLKYYLKRFCTKSNGISIFARSDLRGIDRVKKDIMGMYDFQCEVEKYLKLNSMEGSVDDN